MPIVDTKSVRRLAGGKAAHFAKILGSGKGGLHGWLHGDHIPSFHHLVNIALTCNCSIIDVLKGNQDAIEESLHIKPRILAPVSPRRKAPKKINLKQLGKKLRSLAVQEPPITPSKAAAELGVDVRTLYKYFADIAKGMTRRFRDRAKQEADLRFEKKCILYRRSAEKLLQQGKRPTRRLVAVDLK